MNASTTFDDIIRIHEPEWHKEHLPPKARWTLGQLASKTIARDLALELGLEVLTVHLQGAPSPRP